MRRTLPLALALLLLVPMVHAGATAGFSADLSFASGVHLRGQAILSAPDAVLNLSGAVREGEHVGLAWASGRGYEVTAEWDRLSAAPDQKMRGLRENRTVDLTGGRLERVACGPRCQVAVIGLGDEGTEVSMGGRLDGPLRALLEPHILWAQYDRKGQPDAFSHVLPAGALVAGGDSGTRLSEGRAAAAGHVGLFLVDAVATVSTAQGVLHMGTFQRSVPLKGPGDVVLGERTHTGFAYVELDGAVLSMAPGTAAFFVAREAGLTVDGVLSAAQASGVLMLDDGRRIHLDGEAIQVDGVLSGIVRGREDGVLSPPPVAADAAPMRADVRGEARALSVDGQAVVASPAPAAAPLATGFALATLLAVLAVLLHGGATALYSRINPARVLSHDRRREIHRILQARPGLTPTELSREMGLSRVVLQHHLRMLVTHHMLAARKEGRRTAYFVTGQVPPAESLQAHAALRGSTRRHVAEALVQAGRPLTQEALAEAAGMSQRLVSYHLGQLQEGGLVAAEGPLPRRYHPTPLLLAMLEGVVRATRESAEAEAGGAVVP